MEVGEEAIWELNPSQNLQLPIYDSPGGSDSAFYRITSVLVSVVRRIVCCLLSRPIDVLLSAMSVY